jgi:hypothetical protein
MKKDLLEVGNSGMTSDEQATHFAFWAAAKYNNLQAPVDKKTKHDA